MILQLMARLGLNASGFNLGMKRAESLGVATAKNLKSQFASAFGNFLTVAAVTRATQSIAQFAGEVTDTAQRLGLSTDAVQQFGFAAEQSGASIDDISRALINLAKVQSSALGGDGNALNAFARLGVSLDDLKSKNPEGLFRQLAASLNSMGPSSQATADSMLLLGKAGAELLPALYGGFSEAADEAERLGIVVKESVISELDRMGDQWAATVQRMRADSAPFFAWAGRRVQDLVGGLSYIGRFAGTLSGSGTSIGDILKSAVSPEARKKIAGDLSAAHEAGTQAMMSYYDSDAASASRTHRRAVAPIEQFSAIRDFAAGLPIARAMAGQTVASFSRPEGLNQWQQLGAAVNQRADSPEARALKEIAVSSQETARNTAGLNLLNKGEFGGGAY